MAGHQKFEISGSLTPKAGEFLGKFHMDIEGSLPVIFSGFQ